MRSTILEGRQFAKTNNVRDGRVRIREMGVDEGAASPDCSCLNGIYGFEVQKNLSGYGMGACEVQSIERAANTCPVHARSF